MPKLSRKDGWYVSVAVVLFMAMALATAIGSATAMIGFLVAAVIAFVLMVIFTPRTQLRSGLLIALMGAVIGIGTWFALTRFIPMNLFR